MYSCQGRSRNGTAFLLLRIAHKESDPFFYDRHNIKIIPAYDAPLFLHTLYFALTLSGGI